MKIAIVQSYIHWENSDKNLVHFSNLLDQVTGVDLIILPEMFNTGFTMNSSNVSQTEEGSAVRWMKETAAQKNAIIVGSVIINECNNYYNRLFWVTAEGATSTYDKRHLFRMANEHEHFSPGNKKLITEVNGFKFCPQICYDLRFPVWSRNVDENGNSPIYDCLIYVANWPEARSDAWTSLLKARAIENQAFVVGVNRIGEDGKGITYSGDSRVFSPKGKRLDSTVSKKETIDVIELDLSELNKFREQFPVGKDADTFTISR